MTRLAAPIGFALGCLAALAVFGLAEAIVHSGMSPFEPAASTSIVGEP